MNSISDMHKKLSTDCRNTLLSVLIFCLIFNFECKIAAEKSRVQSQRADHLWTGGPKRCCRSCFQRQFIWAAHSQISRQSLCDFNFSVHRYVFRNIFQLLSTMFRTNTMFLILERHSYTLGLQHFETSKVQYAC